MNCLCLTGENCMFEGMNWLCVELVMYENYHVHALHACFMEEGG